MWNPFCLAMCLIAAFTQQFTATGEVASQYDLVEAYMPDPNSACDMIQQAMIRVWVEDREWYAYQRYWTTEVDRMADGV